MKVYEWYHSGGYASWERIIVVAEDEETARQMAKDDRSFMEKKVLDGKPTKISELAYVFYDCY